MLFVALKPESTPTWTTSRHTLDPPRSAEAESQETAQEPTSRLCAIAVLQNTCFDLVSPSQLSQNLEHASVRACVRACVHACVVRVCARACVRACVRGLVGGCMDLCVCVRVCECVCVWVVCVVCVVCVCVCVSVCFGKVCCRRARCL